MSMPDARAGMSRRQLIRAAAATGVAAWTAPVILGSIASPAAAATPCVCTHYYGAKIEGISEGNIVISKGFTGQDANTGQWAGFHPGLVLCTGGTSGGCNANYTLPTYTAATATVVLPPGCSFGAAGTVFAHYGNGNPPTQRTWQVTGDDHVYNAEPGTQNNFGAIQPTDATFSLPSQMSLSGVNVIWCCCS